MDDGLFYVRAVGVSHYQEALEQCGAGDPVRFVHEPDNPYDEMALRIETASGATIGYVGRDNWLRKAIHEQGRGVAGTIASVGYGRSCLLGATISVAICDDTIATRSYFPGRPAPEAPRGGFRYWVNTPAAAAQLARERT